MPLVRVRGVVLKSCKTSLKEEQVTAWLPCSMCDAVEFGVPAHMAQTDPRWRAEPPQCEGCEYFECVPACARACLLALGGLKR